MYGVYIKGLLLALGHDVCRECNKNLVRFSHLELVPASAGSVGGLPDVATSCNIAEKRNI